MIQDTIFALSSGRPPAAIAVIRVSGPLAHYAGALLAGALPDARTAAVRTLYDPASKEPLDEVIALRFDSPNSATAEDVVEFHCHGGRAVTASILAAFGAIGGLREAQPGEFTRRAFANGRIDLTEAEGLADLLEAETEAQRRSALAVADGGLRRQVEHWRAQLVDLSARAEAAIDYSEDDEGVSVDEALANVAEALANELGGWLQRPRIEPLRDGIRVVIAGPPNAGKSSLLNRIAGVDRAIVSDVAGTTRDFIEVPMTIGGVALLLTDTAGLHEAEDIEALGVERAERLIRGADVLLWLGNVREAPSHCRRIDVHSKSDVSGPGLSGTIPVSAATGEGMEILLIEILRLAAELLPPEDGIALNRRQSHLLEQARENLASAASSPDLAILADGLRAARLMFDKISGRAGIEDVLDSLFSRFCLGK